jgi:NADH-quinone oxidoreductase subunit F
MAPVLLTSARGDVEGLEEYRKAGGWQALEKAVQSLTPAQVIAEVEASGLRGRGGAAFPTARKWSLAAQSPGEPHYVVANGGEHEPGSLKDRLLIARHPHKILEGIALCAFATGASRAYLYLIEDMTEARAAAQRAIDEAASAGLIGAQILGSRFSLEITLALAPPTYVAGEETAALEVIEGRKAWPRQKPPFPGQAGLFGKPTTVNNVETLACVPSIIRDGAAQYRKLGASDTPGTMLCTLDDRVARPGVYEVPFGITLRDLIYTHGGGPKSGRGIRGILPAMSSSFLPAGALDTPMTHDALKAAGSSLGCGGVSFIEEGECAVERVATIAEFFKTEQCGQCPPCRMETGTLATVMRQVRAGTDADYAAQVDKITAFAKGKGYCSLIAMAAAPVQSALRCFPGDFAHHARHGACPA